MPKLSSSTLRKKIFLAVAGVVFLSLAVGGFFYYQQHAYEKELAEIEANKLENKIIKARLYREKNPLDNHYVKLTSNHYNRIQTNVNDGKFRTYVTAEIVLKVQDSSTASNLKNVLPLIEHKANTLLSAIPAQDLRSAFGRNAFTQQVLLFANDLLDPELTTLYKNQFNTIPTNAGDDKSETDSLPFEITTEDLPIQAVLFEAFVINR